MKAKYLVTVILAGAMVFTMTAGIFPENHVAAVRSAAALPSNSLNLGDDGIRSLNFDKDWKFVLANPDGIDDPTGLYGNAAAPLANAVDYDDSSWRSLDLPHDWSIELLPVSSGGGVSGGTGYFKGGLGWYRKTFTLPPSMTGKKISVEFDGVYMDSYVYLNGQLLGNHPYGYTGFNFDLTPLVHTDGVTANVLAVVVQNRLPSSRWYSGSGIYRNVHLIVTDPIHVARWGTFVTTPDLENTIQSGYANVHVQTDVQNESGQDATVDIVSTIRDAAGAVVAQATSNGVQLGSQVYTDNVDIQVSNPRLWSMEDPYLYTLETQLVVGGNAVDTYHTTFGIRYYKIDPNLGFSLNGEHTKLQGVDLHHDQGALGSAINYDALMREMTILKSMGVNSFRTSHNPPAPEMLDVNQRLGIVMMVEAFDCWSQRKTTYDYARFFNDWSDYDIKEMVNEAKNNPAVIMWSIGNEIPGFTSVSNLPTAQRLIDDIRSIDNTRYVVAGSDQYRNVPSTGSGAEQVLLKLDGMGLNYNTAKSVDGLHAKYPTKFFFESESSSETSSRGVYQDPNYVNTGENNVPGRRGASSYDNNFASWTMPNEYGLKKDRDRQYFLGQYIWSGFDYIGEPTPYGVFPVKVSSFGTIDTAGFPKDSYYLFKSQWTTDPMVHLVPMNWTDYKPGENVQVWAYANVDTVELFLNGVSLGEQSFVHKTSLDGVQYLETSECSNDDKNYADPTCPGSYTSPNGGIGKLHLTWNVPFELGELLAVAKQGGVEVARDVLQTAGPAYTLKLTPDKKVISADGKSLSYITIEVVDKNGVMLPGADNLVNISVSGSGALVGMDNGRQESAEGYKLPSHTAYNGKLLAIVQSTNEQGPVTVTATSSGLQPATTTVFALQNPGGSQLIAIDPVYTRTMVGVYPALPATVQEVFADGTQQTLGVRWNNFPPGQNGMTGVRTILGQVSGTNLKANATVTVYDVGGLESYSTVVPVGQAPALPALLRLVYNDGVDQLVPVTWDPIDPAQYAAPGQFTVKGTVAGVSLPAVASVRVTDDFIANQDIALSTSPLMPTADASYANSNNSLPARMLDGITTTSGWSNFYNKSATAVLPSVSKAHAKEWVSVDWPNPQYFSSMDVYFTVSSTRVLPSELAISYWDGTGFVPVSNPSITWAAASNQPTHITFDPVATTQIRLDLTSPLPDVNTGFMQIAEIQVWGTQVTYNTTASLTDLSIDGQTIPGFDPNTTSYTVPTGAKLPEVSATPADNGRLLIVPPLTVPGTMTILVTSEDGLTQKTYTIDFVLGQ